VEPYTREWIQERRNYKNGKLDGEEKIWFSPNVLQFRSNWRNGVRHGVSETYQINPRTMKSYLIKRTNHKDGKLNGLYEEFMWNGLLKNRKHYLDGELDGLSETFHENGQLGIRGNYKDGVLQG
tara:strand:+ start:1990 stop:2361 length:372 start_codon:yes stop_codon:yes gene_type:complete